VCVKYNQRRAGGKQEGQMSNLITDSIFPLQGRCRGKYPIGSNERVRRKWTERSEVASRIVKHLNTLVANNPAEVQQYSFFRIANALGVTVKEVKAALDPRLGGDNGVTFGVREKDRIALAEAGYRPQTPPADSVV
jgi:hypothetical protein